MTTTTNDVSTRRSGRNAGLSRSKQKINAKDGRASKLDMLKASRVAGKSLLHEYKVCLSRKREICYISSIGGGRRYV